MIAAAASLLTIAFSMCALRHAPNILPNRLPPSLTKGAPSFVAMDMVALPLTLNRLPLEKPVHLHDAPALAVGIAERSAD
jgi:hypothetical protein